MRTMFKAYVWNPVIAEVPVIKDTGKTITYSIPKINITEHLTGVATGEVLIKREAKESDWYRYCDTKQEAKAWLLLVAINARHETLQKLERQEAAIADLKKINIHN